MAKPKEPDQTPGNNTDKITADFFPDNSVSVFVKSNGQLYTRGALIEPMNTSDGLYRSLARVKGVLHGVQLTLFYTLGKQPKNVDLDVWYAREQAGRRTHDRLMGVPEEDLS